MFCMFVLKWISIYGSSVLGGVSLPGGHATCREGLVEDQSGEFDPNFHQSFCSTLKKGLRAKSSGGSGFLQPRGNRSLNRSTSICS